MSVIKIAILGVAGALFAVQFKQQKSEYAIYICIAMSLVIFFSITDEMEIILNTMREISGLVSFDTTYLTTLLKMLGITYVAELASGICKDAGFQTIASQIEIFSKLTILVLSLPILLALLKTIQNFMV